MSKSLQLFIITQTVKFQEVMKLFKESAKCGKPGVTSNFVTHMKVILVGGY